MSRRFKIEKDYNTEGEYMYKKMHVTFEPGLTVLIGCNGCGKSSLIRQVQHIVRHDLKLPCISYDNVHEGGAASINKAMFKGDMGFVSLGFISSEGEQIALNLQQIAMQIGSMFKKYTDEKEFWIFLDGIDSGLSIDAIEDLKRGLFDTIFNTYPDKEVYIIASANEYELARGEQCFDTVECRYVNIKSYTRYRNIILKSREYKDNRQKERQKEVQE